MLREWVTHDNRGRPHASWGPAIPDPPPELNELMATGHHVPEHLRVIATTASADYTMSIVWRRRGVTALSIDRTAFLRTTPHHKS
jgi:hypothetical protein